MAKSSLDELREKIAAGEYAIDSGALAGRILTDFAVIRRVRRIVIGAAGSATFRPR
ncbi:MAG TPA: flagellar biosynthesis anti-sigma factor FlgM [Solirubrobacterales bacterium]|nr:flagellar biosynthesis anti-sigma factor FlgM [Solirubrobacterales bacterium]